MANELSWIPLYRDIAKALLQWEDRQPELVKILQELDEQQVPVKGLFDQKIKDMWVPLEVMDPFSFMASFNRPLKDSNRTRMLEHISQRLGVTQAIPTHIEVPWVNPQSWWYFPYQYMRPPDDISSLWALARGAVEQGRDGITADLWERVLKIHTVGIPKLTMGLFWMHPDCFLSIDQHTRAAVERLGISASVSTRDEYFTLLKALEAKGHTDFVRITREAYASDGSTQKYWAGGFQWGNESMLELFTTQNYWQLHSGSDGPKNSTQRAWAHFRKIQIGDLFAIKGIGGQHQAVIYYVGQVQKVDEKGGRLDLIPLDQTEQHMKAPSGPGAGNWRDTLVPVQRSEDIQQIFGQVNVPPPPPKPSAPRPSIPKNLILYGAPGTGKTWHLQNVLQKHFVQEGVHEQAAGTPDPIGPGSPGPQTRFHFTTLHASYSYEDFIEGIRPRVESSGPGDKNQLDYRLEDGLFMQAVRSAIRSTGFEGTLDQFCVLRKEERKLRLDQAPAHAIFLDEINRCNVARVFGELISLIEPDKRLGEENELIVTLPGSKRKFGVPSNLYVIGTMNTADRSIEALDTALRRRFAFEATPPRPDLVAVTVEGVQLDRLLTIINRRLQVLYDRDHQIGHSYFMGLKKTPTLEGLRQVFAQHLLPLLEEYFYGDPARIGLVLGKRFVKLQEVESIAFADFGDDRLPDLIQKRLYEFTPVETLTADDFRSIYEDV